MSIRRVAVATFFYLVLIPVAQLLADTFDSTNRDVVNVAAYPDGSFVLTMSSAVPGNPCQYSQVGEIAPTAPAFKLVSSLGLTAYTSHRKVQIIYNGCYGGGNSGNLNMTGLILPPQ